MAVKSCLTVLSHYFGFDVLKRLFRLKPDVISLQKRCPLAEKIISFRAMVVVVVNRLV